MPGVKRTKKRQENLFILHAAFSGEKSEALVVKTQRRRGKPGAPPAKARRRKEKTVKTREETRENQNSEGFPLLEDARSTLAACSLEEAKALRESLEKPWTEAQERENRLIEALKDEYRKAGAHEAQFAWGTFTNVPVGFKAQHRILKICREQDKLRREVFPLMCLAAAVNERIAELS